MSTLEVRPDSGRAVASPLDAEAIYRFCIEHAAVKAVRDFNRHLARRPLTRDELRLFFASMAAFNRYTIAGIAILAGRMSDELMPVLPTDAHAVSANVLDAAADEYGLRETSTHLELARDFAEYLGVSRDEVENSEFACPSAVELGDLIHGWYRDEPVAFALGVHTASEVTSVEEFMPWHDTFLKFPEYGLSPDVPAFAYMRAHYDHEPDHTTHSKECVDRYLRALGSDGRQVLAGCEAYLDRYRTMFEELTGRLFG